MTMDISNFYLLTPPSRTEYTRIKITDLPGKITAEYSIKDKATKDGAIYIEANKGIHGLPQSIFLANELLEKRLNKHGYHQRKLVPGLWKHIPQPIHFTLVVDNFGVKYKGEEQAIHLKNTL